MPGAKLAPYKYYGRFKVMFLKESESHLQNRIDALEDVLVAECSGFGVKQPVVEEGEEIIPILVTESTPPR